MWSNTKESLEKSVITVRHNSLSIAIEKSRNAVKSHMNKCGFINSTFYECYTNNAALHILHDRTKVELEVFPEFPPVEKRLRQTLFCKSRQILCQMV